MKDVNDKIGTLQLNVVHCMDCFEGMNNIEAEKIDLMVTSPPYFNAKEYSQYKDYNDYLSQMKSIFTETFRILKTGKMCIVNISPVIVARQSRQHQSYRHALPFHFVVMMEKIGFEFLEDIIWEKPSGSAINRNGGFFRHRKPMAYKPNLVTEYILVFKRPAPFLIDKSLKNHSLVLGDYEQTNIWKINPETKSDHPAPYPEKLVENCIKYYSYEGDVVLDIFMGSGTTALVARRLKRKFIGFEMNPEYVAIANKRLQQETLL